MSKDCADIGSHRLLPLMINLPFADADKEAGFTSLSVSLSAPKETAILPVDEYTTAHQYLKDQERLKQTTVIAVGDLHCQKDNKSCFKLSWNSLPPRSCGVIAWLTLPNRNINLEDDFEFVNVQKDFGQLIIHGKNEVPQAVIQIPAQSDCELLQVPLPGLVPMGNLWRVQLTTPKTQPREQPMILFNLTLSDKSGSTSRTMRYQFNELAESRFLKRLETTGGYLGGSLSSV